MGGSAPLAAFTVTDVVATPVSTAPSAGAVMHTRATYAPPVGPCWMHGALAADAVGTGMAGSGRRLPNSRTRMTTLIARLATIRRITLTMTPLEERASLMVCAFPQHDSD